MRVLVPRGSAVVGQRTSLDEGEAHHLRVRRARKDEGVEVLDGAGLTGTGRLVRSGAEWLVEIESAERQPAGPELILAVAAGDRERFTWMAEKAVEVGVTAIVPLDTSRSVGVATRLRRTHTEKLRRIILEATKQCGSAWAPDLRTPISLADFTARPIQGRGWLADPAGGIPAGELDETPLTVVVGPEGGLTPEERAAILSSGYQPVVLGPNTLRFETAALAAAAVAVTARMRRNHG
jgi:16S rRNA (uracil1498-N3)-methyltransferase